VNWTKQNISIIIAVVMAGFGAYTFLHTYNADKAEAQRKHEEQIIYQHDLEQRFDSLANAFTILYTDYNDFKNNRVTLTKQRDEEKLQNERVHYEFGIRITKIETRFDDFLLYKNQHK
jgi:hypothetical protein